LATLRAGVAALEGRNQDAVIAYQEAARTWRERGWLPGLAYNQLEAAMLLGADEPLSTIAAKEARDVLTRLAAEPLLARLEEATRATPQPRSTRTKAASPAT
jgi:hypothetical protein